MESDVKGVNFLKTRGRWITRVYKNNKPKTIYYGESKEEAEKARIEFDGKKKYNNIPQSQVSGVSCNTERGSERWVAQGWQEGKKVSLYWGKSKEQAEEARLTWDKNNPKKKRVFHPTLGEYIVPDIRFYTSHVDPAYAFDFELDR